jgi:hypothetical protein
MERLLNRCIRAEAPIQSRAWQRQEMGTAAKGAKLLERAVGLLRCFQACSVDVSTHQKGVMTLPVAPVATSDQGPRQNLSASGLFARFAKKHQRALRQWVKLSPFFELTADRLKQ